MSRLLDWAARMDALVLRAGRFGSWLILPLIAVIVFDVLTRKFQWIQQLILNSPLHAVLSPTKLQEMEWHLHAAVFLLAYGMTYLLNGHVRVDVLREGMPRRRQGWIELFGLLVFALPFTLVILVHSWDFVARAYLSGEGSAALTGLPQRWIVKSFVLIGVLLLLLSILSVMIRLWAMLVTGGAAGERAAAELAIFSGGDAAPDGDSGGPLT